MATNNNSLPQQEEQSSIDLKELMFKMLDKWYYFVICLIVTILVFFVISKFTTTQYQAKATLLIKSNENALSQLTLLSNDFGKNKANFQNEIGQIQSFSMAKRTIKELDLFKLQTVDLPIEVHILSKDKVQISYKDKNNSSQYDYGQDMLIESNLSIRGKETTLSFGQWYEADGMKFRLILNEDIPFKNNLTKSSYSFVINDIDEIAKEFNSTKIDLINKESTIINIAFNYPNQKKAIDYLNMLCKLYIDLTFEEKNYMNTSTIKFVDAQIANIADSLTKTERIREEFQVRNNTVDLGGDAKYLFDKANELETKRAEE